MKINTKIILKNLKGNNILNEDKTPYVLGQIISEALLLYETGGKMKCFSLANKFYNNEVVEVDASDFKLVKDSIEALRGNNLYTGQALVFLGDIKEDK